MKYKAAIFDMDGTVLDTLDDLADAVKYVMLSEGHTADFNVAEVRNFFGSGALVAFCRALAFEAGAGEKELLEIGDEDAGAEAQRLMRIFADYYPQHCEEKTRPFPGIPETLKELRKAGIKLAVVSNKIDDAVQIMTENYFPGLFDFALGMKQDIRRKPYPDMVEKCLAELGINAEEAVYIGDSEIDLQTAKAAGTDCISVTWGFRSAEFLERNGAETIVSEADKLKDEINGDQHTGTI